MRIYHVDIPRFALVLATLDIVIVSLGIRLAAGLGGGVALATGEAALVLSCVLVPAFAMGLYQRSFIKPRKLMLRALGAGIASLSFAALAHSTAMLDRFDGTTIRLSLGATLVLVLNRLVTCRLAEAPRFKSRVLTIGTPDTARSITGLQQRLQPSRFHCVETLLVPEDGTAGRLPQQIATAWRGGRIDEIVIQTDLRADPALAEALLACRLGGARVSTLASFIESETRRIEIDAHEAMRLVFSAGSQRGIASRTVKRAIDVVVSAAILAFTLPVTLFAALAVYLGDRQPVFYRQDRVGLGGQVFRILKFRTMRMDAEADGVARWATVGDRRTTQVGAFLRRTRIDEIPQLFNVLAGDMSLVGPRPERPSIVADLEQHIPFYAFRHVAVPGLTGWAQINYPYGASLVDAQEKMRYDLYYMKNGSVILDLVILMQTVRVVLFGEGGR